MMLYPIPAPPRWVTRARCGQSDPAVFFPKRGEDSATAKAICAGCPVRHECFVAGFREKWGMWGGVSERERRLLRRAWGDAETAWAALEQEEAEHRRQEVAERAREAALRAKRAWKPAYLRTTGEEVAS